MLRDVLDLQLEAWNARPLVRRLYRDWYEEIGRALSPVAAPTVELGAGIGRLQERFPFVVATDVEETPYAQQVVNAEALPYADGSLANLVLFDVFHHLARPASLLDECRRTLVSGGRLVIVDPYCSPVSTVAYRRFHAERTDPSGPGLDDDPALAVDPFDSNQARATIVFFRELDRLRARWPELELVERRRFAFLLYPLSGGFTGRRLTPASAYRPLMLVERALAPLAPLLAFRCLVVLERA